MIIQPVIMSGGSGTRLWPMSRSASPKQFLKLVTQKTMFQETALRVDPAIDRQFANPVVIAGAKHGPIINDQFSDLGIQPSEVILEPLPRNTAAVAAVAATWTTQELGDALVLLMPADHHVGDPEAFRRCVSKAADAAKQGFITTFGIKATHPHTGYGYIETGGLIVDDVYQVAAFKEKPTADIATEYLAKGGFFWNGGIFLFKASAMLAEFDKHALGIKTAATKALDRSVRVGSARRLNESEFAQCRSDSIDYAIMEKTDKAAIIAPVEVGWRDIGSWSEVTTAVDDTKIFEVDGAKNNIIRSDKRFVSAIGVENLIIVSTDDAVLVARKDDAQSVRLVVDHLKAIGREDLL